LIKVMILIRSRVVKLIVTALEEWVVATWMTSSQCSWEVVVVLEQEAVVEEEEVVEIHLVAWVVRVDKAMALPSDLAENVSYNVL